jgi:hypothetical protein
MALEIRYLDKGKLLGCGCQRNHPLAVGYDPYQFNDVATNEKRARKQKRELRSVSVKYW